MKFSKIATGLVAIALATVPSFASAQVWTDWTGSLTGGCIPSPGPVSGTLGGNSVSISGPYVGYQTGGGQGCGGLPSNTSYFYQGNNPLSPYGAYTQSGLAAPLMFGLIQFSTTVNNATITFGSAVIDPYIAFVSVGQGGTAVTYDFGNAPVSVLSNNTGYSSYWGGGNYSLSGNKLTGYEFSGVIQLTGTYNSITFSIDKPEYWHGITVGARVASVPEPSTFAIMAVGLVALGLVSRRRRLAE